MADQQNFAPVPVMTRSLMMDLGNQRAGRIKKLQSFLRCRFGYGFGHPVGGKNHWPISRYFIKFIDKYRAHFLQSLDDEPVMNNFMPHKNRRTEFMQRLLDNLDCPVHTRTETAGRGQIDP